MNKKRYKSKGFRGGGRANFRIFAHATAIRVERHGYCAIFAKERERERTESSDLSTNRRYALQAKSHKSVQTECIALCP